MGCADYHQNPVVVIRPFASCKKSHRQLNDIGAVSQLYSHWQGKDHEGNPAARVLEARWRLALDNKDKSASWLDQRQPLDLSNDRLERGDGAPWRRGEVLRARAPPDTGSDRLQGLGRAALGRALCVAAGHRHHLSAQCTCTCVCSLERERESDGRRGVAERNSSVWEQRNRACVPYLCVSVRICAICAICAI